MKTCPLKESTDRHLVIQATTVYNLVVGGVLGGVIEGDLLFCGELLCWGGMHIMQRLLGLGPKFIPPQPVHGGLGGGDHGDSKPLQGGGGSCAAGVVGGGEGWDARC